MIFTAQYSLFYWFWLSLNLLVFAQQNILYKELTRKFLTNKHFKRWIFFENFHLNCRVLLAKINWSQGRLFFLNWIYERCIICCLKLNFIHGMSWHRIVNHWVFILSVRRCLEKNPEFWTPDHKNHRGNIRRVYYRGVAIGLPESGWPWYFEDQLIGVISLPVTGNLVLGKAKSGSQQNCR